MSLIKFPDVTCKECGKVEDPNRWFGAEERVALSLCFQCEHWHSLWLIRDEARVARIDGKHYIITNEAPSYAGSRGFGGARFTIKFFDGRTVVSTNLWCQGTVPAHWASRLPNNAVMS